MFIDRIVYCKGKNNPFSLVKKRIDKIIEEYQLDGFSDNINNIMELYNSVQYINELTPDDYVSVDEVSEYKKHTVTMNKMIGVAFSKINSDNFDIYANNLKPSYAKDFWYNMCSRKRIDGIIPEKFSAYISSNPHHINAILSQEELATSFSDILYNQFLSNPDWIRIIIDYLFKKTDASTSSLYIKGYFTGNQLNTLFKAYINSQNPSINMLHLIEISQNDPQVGLDDEIRLLAKNKQDELYSILLKDAHTITHGFCVSFKPSDKPVQYVENNGIAEFTYDTDWIHENTDYPTLFNNFIYVFEFSDLQMRSSFPLTNTVKTPILDLFRIRGKKEYSADGIFNMYRNLMSVRVLGYREELKRDDIQIEELFKWFFEKYLVDEFSVPGFIFTPPSSGTTYLEKCKLLATEIDSILKQYKLYHKYGKINWELFEMSSEHIVFSELYSIQERKYLYAKSDRIKHCMHYLFNNEMMCLINDEIVDNCENLFDVLNSQHDVTKGCYKLKPQIDAIEMLIDFGVINDTNGVLSLNKKIARILSQLHYHEILCWHYCKSEHEEIETLIKNGDIVESNTLFSKPENEYLNYILNKAQYSNGLDLRNRYIHGSCSREEKDHYADYAEFLKIMVLIIIKINEEFCLKFPESDLT